jgi:tetratricopeptide (TPR) repeat protein
LNRPRYDNRKSAAPFRLPVVNYYLLTFIAAVVVYLAIWYVGQEGRGGENTQIFGLIAGLAVIVFAIIVREVVMRSARRKLYREQRLLDQNIAGFHRRQERTNQKDKVSLEQNELILNELRKKSEAAKVLSGLAAGHREVVAMCSEYLSMNQRELQNVGVGSPRIASFVRGRETASKLHFYHLMKWAELETKEFTQIAVGRDRIEDKLDRLKQTLTVVETALEAYPTEKDLLESKRALIASERSLEISRLIENAETAATGGDNYAAAENYEKALGMIEELESTDANRAAIAEKVAGELHRVRSLGGEKIS